MRRCGFIFKLFIVVIFFFVSPKKANADDLDNRLAELEKKNFKLRKLLRIEALEKENAALSQKLNLKPMGSPTQEHWVRSKQREAIDELRTMRLRATIRLRPNQLLLLTFRWPNG